MHCSKAIDPPFQVAWNLVLETMIARGGGPLVGVSSVAAAGGSGAAQAYSATKTFVALYLEVQRENASRQVPGAGVIEGGTGVRPHGHAEGRPTVPGGVARRAG